MITNSVNGCIDESEVVGWGLLHLQKGNIFILKMFLKGGAGLDWQFRSNEERQYTINVLTKAITKNRKFIDSDLIIGERTEVK